MLTSEIITRLNSDLINHAFVLAPRLQEFGLPLLQGLAVISLSWLLLSKMLSERGVNELVAELMIFGLRLGILTYFVTDLVPVSKEVLAGFDLVSEKLAGSRDAGGAISIVLASLSQIALNLFDVPAPNGGGTMNPITAYMRALSGDLTIVVKGGILLCVTLISATIGAMIVISQVLVGIAIPLGAIALPWLMIESLSFITQGWIRFFLSACLYKVVGVMIMSYITAMSSTFSEIANAVRQTDPAQAATTDLVGAIVILTVCLVMLMLCLQIGSIANGIMSGSSMASLKLPNLSAGKNKEAKKPNQPPNTDTPKKE